MPSLLTPISKQKSISLQSAVSCCFFRSLSFVDIRYRFVSVLCAAFETHDRLRLCWFASHSLASVLHCIPRPRLGKVSCLVRPVACDECRWSSFSSRRTSLSTVVVSCIIKQTSASNPVLTSYFRKSYARGYGKYLVLLCYFSSLYVCDVRCQHRQMPMIARY
jgi:hypothetical protein